MRQKVRSKRIIDGMCAGKLRHGCNMVKSDLLTKELRTEKSDASSPIRWIAVRNWVLRVLLGSGAL